MRHRSICLIIATVAWFAAVSISAQDRISWRDQVRLHGDTNILVELCGPITGLKEILEVTQLTVEGTITSAEGRLTAEGDQVYTEYEIDVIRVFRAPTATMRSTAGPITSPLVTDASPTPDPITRPRVRVRRPHHGRVILDGGVLTVTSGSPTLEVGQHIIVSAHFDASRGWWVLHGTFEVRDGRVLRLDERFQTKDYDSVEEFTTALANPPRTTHPSER